MRVPALCVWTIALLGVFAVPVHGQGELADRIAEQRDRAEVDAATPAESAETPAADAAIETDIAETDIAETELAPIPAPVFAEDQLPLGPTPADGEVGSAGDKAPLLGRNWMMMGMEHNFHIHGTHFMILDGKHKAIKIHDKIYHCVGGESERPTISRC